MAKEAAAQPEWTKGIVIESEKGLEFTYFYEGVLPSHWLEVKLTVPQPGNRVFSVNVMPKDLQATEVVPEHICKTLGIMRSVPFDHWVAYTKVESETVGKDKFIPTMEAMLWRINQLAPIPKDIRGSMVEDFGVDAAKVFPEWKVQPRQDTEVSTMQAWRCDIPGDFYLWASCTFNPQSSTRIFQVSARTQSGEQIALPEALESTLAPIRLRKQELRLDREVMVPRPHNTYTLASVKDSFAQKEFVPQVCAAMAAVHKIAPVPEVMEEAIEVFTGEMLSLKRVDSGGITLVDLARKAVGRHVGGYTKEALDVLPNDLLERLPRAPGSHVDTLLKERAAGVAKDVGK